MCHSSIREVVVVINFRLRAVLFLPLLCLQGQTFQRFRTEVWFAQVEIEVVSIDSIEVRFF